MNIGNFIAEKDKVNGILFLDSEEMYALWECNESELNKLFAEFSDMEEALTDAEDIANVVVIIDQDLHYEVELFLDLPFSSDPLNIPENMRNTISNIIAHKILSNDREFKEARKEAYDNSDVLEK